MAARWAGKHRESPMPATAVVPSPAPGPWLHSSLCWMGNGGPGHEPCPDLPCLGSGGIDFWRVPMKWIGRVQMGCQAQQAANSPYALILSG